MPPSSALDLSNKVNISQSYISRFENGRTILDIDLLERILASLSTDLSTYLAGDEDLPEDFIQLIDTLKTLSSEARRKLNEFSQLMKE
ncbi:helix-turn-helix domain-containing protein [Virgibacillus oceani]